MLDIKGTLFLNIYFHSTVQIAAQNTSKATVNFLILVWLKLVTLARRRTYNNTVNLKLRAPDKAANHGRF